MSNKIILDSEPLIPSPCSSVSEIIDELGLPEEEKPQKTVKFYRFVPLELVLLLYFCSFITTVPVTQFYIYGRIAEKYGIKNAVQSDNQSQCFPSNRNKSESNILNKIQEDSAEQFLYLSFASTFPAIIPCLFLGSVSDRYGRKVALLVPIIGLLIRQIIYVIVFQLKAHVGFLYIGNAIEGCSGFFGSALMACFGMIADITTPGKQRAFRIAVLEGIVAISLGLTLLGTGYWIQYSGFIIPMVSTAVLSLVTIVLIIIFIPETHQTRDKNKLLFSLRYIVRCFNFYFQDDGTERRNKLITSVLILLISVAVLLARSNVSTLFLLNRPFCWTAVHITTFSALQTVGNWACALVLMVLMQKVLNMQDYSLLILGTVSGIASNIEYAFSERDWMIYMYAVIGVFSVISVPMTRSIMSRLCSPEEQGALFAGIGCIEMTVTSVAGILYSIIYKQTVSYFPGLTFLVMAAMMVVALFCALPLFYWLRKERKVETLIVRVPEPDIND